MSQHPLPPARHQPHLLIPPAQTINQEKTKNPEMRSSFDKLDDIVDEYNNTYHRTSKMEPIDVKNNTCINIDIELNDNDPEFKVGDHVRISKYINIFAKGYVFQIGLKKFL